MLGVFDAEILEQAVESTRYAAGDYTGNELEVRPAVHREKYFPDSETLE